jgi:hypothetical protein
LSFFSKPLLTPPTMLATRARMVPLIASASAESLAGLKLSLPASFLVTATSGFSLRTSVPLLPLTVMLPRP